MAFPLPSSARRVSARSCKRESTPGYTVAYFALQLAVYMGFKEVFCLGLDLRHENGSTHFFGNDFHSRNHEQIEFPRMQKMLTFGAKQLAGTGVRVFNCSPISTLECFGKVTYDYALSP